MTSLKLKLKEDPNGPKVQAKETEIPFINVHMEEADRDPLEAKKFEDERHLEKQRIKDIQQMELADSKVFQQILASQNANLGTLTALEHNSSQLLDKVTHSTY